MKISNFYVIFVNFYTDLISNVFVISENFYTYYTLWFMLIL